MILNEDRQDMEITLHGLILISKYRFQFKFLIVFTLIRCEQSVIDVDKLTHSIQCIGCIILSNTGEIIGDQRKCLIGRLLCECETEICTACQLLTGKCTVWQRLYMPDPADIEISGYETVDIADNETGKLCDQRIGGTCKNRDQCIKIICF